MFLSLLSPEAANSEHSDVKVNLQKAADDILLYIYPSDVTVAKTTRDRSHVAGRPVRRPQSRSSGISRSLQQYDPCFCLANMQRHVTGLDRIGGRSRAKLPRHAYRWIQ